MDWDRRWGGCGRWTAESIFVGRTRKDIGGRRDVGARGKTGISFLAFNEGMLTGGLLAMACVSSGWLLLTALDLD